ncbi:MAG TPA: alpha/beta fold hydrolase [Thermoanaerobaculia bacterium]|nr:alpha/beta fold hydrolase [Thermoanaerobaculia bacterium]
MWVVFVGLLISLCITSCSTIAPPPPPPPESHWVPRGDGWAPRQHGVNGVVIFVHGLFGDADGTWRFDSKHASWPELVAKDSDFASDDVYVVGYATSYGKGTFSIEETAVHVLQQLYDTGLLSYDRIYFVTHSMGGLIVKRMLNMLNDKSGVADLHRVRAVLLISTPSQGAPVAEIGTWLRMSPILNDLIPATFNTFLQGLEDDWARMLRGRDRDHADYPQVYCAYETLPIHHLRIVSRVYAATRCDNELYPMNYDHVQIVKPRDMSHDPYPWAKARIHEADELRVH